MTNDRTWKLYRQVLLPDGEVRIALDSSKAQQTWGSGYLFLKHGKPTALAAIPDEIWTPFATRLRRACRIKTRSIGVLVVIVFVGLGAWAMINPGATVESGWTLLGLLVGVPLGFLILVLGIIAWWNHNLQQIIASFQDDFLTHGYEVELDIDRYSGCYQDLYYVRFVEVAKQGTMEKPVTKYGWVYGRNDDENWTCDYEPSVAPLEPQMDSAAPRV